MRPQAAGAAEIEAAALPRIDTPGVLGGLDALDSDMAATMRDLAVNGYAILDLGEQALCDAAVAQTESLFANGRFNRIQDAWRRAPAVRRLAAHPEIKRRLDLAYGRESFPFQTLNFRAGSQQGAHTDTAHFHSDPPGFMCGVWWALEDVQPDAGPLFYYPGSHRLPMPKGVNDDEMPVRAREALHMAALAERLAAGGYPKTPALLRKGQVFIWTANLAHGGMPITRAGATRRSLVVHYYFKGCRYMTPLASSGGRMMPRLPINAADGRWVWPRDRSGAAAPISPGKVAVFLGEKLLRAVYRT